MVLPVAALPFLGILGGAAGAYAFGGDLRGRMENRRNARVGGYNQQVMEGVDQRDPAATASALFGGGLLSGSEFQSDARSAFEGQAGRDAAMARTNAAQALGWAKWNHGLAADERMNTAVAGIAQQTGMPEIYAGIPQLQQAWVEKHAGVTMDNLNRTTAQVYQDEAAISNAEEQLRQNQEVSDNTAALTQAWKDHPVYGGFNMPTMQGNATDWAEVSKMLGPKPPAGEEYRIAAQPLKNSVSRYDWAIENLGGASQDADFWSSSDGLKTRQSINQLLVKQRMDYWKNDLGRTDAPSESEVEMLEGLFPLLGPTLQDTKQFELIEQNLMIGKAMNQRQLQDLDEKMARAGQSVPEVQAQSDLPAGWTREGQ